MIMQIQPISDITGKPLPLLSITELHRNVGKIFDELPKVGGYAVVRDSEVIGKILPMNTKSKVLTREERVAKVRALAGGFHLGKGLSPDQMNKEYDKIYDKMLPR